MIGYFSSGIDRIAYLAELLESPCRKVARFTSPRSLEAVAGWGLKPSAARARHYAECHGLPYLSLEDGFLRSLGLGVDGALAHSLIVDRRGIYYDATRASDLEQLILAADLSAAEAARAQNAMALLRRYRLSKYNHAPDDPERLALDGFGPAVLVVDQTAGDASIEYGLAQAATFQQMLEDAITDNPGAQVLVKVHPDVVAGKKRGHLLALAEARGCRLISEDLSPWALLDRVRAVYVVTSQLGFEALVAGKEVHCYGMPFYAGWGLTQDRQSCPRRNRPRSLEAVFSAAYLRYCRYINPYTGSRCEFEDTLALIADQKRARERVSADWLALDFANWKRPFISRFVGGRVDWDSGALVKAPAAGRVLVWASKLTAALRAQCQARQLPLWRIEDGFIRSVGLGVDLVDPLSLVLDSRGIYYDATHPSDLEQLLQCADIAPDLLLRASKLRRRLVEQKLSKYNVGISQRLQLPRGRRILLVPGQVETDASIRYGSLQWKSNRELLEQVRRTNPDAFIVYKPHPDVVGGGRIGVLEGDSLFDLQVCDIAMPELLEQVDEVHTLTSLTGFEALLREIPVTTYGLPFYAGWGLTRDRLTCPRRSRTRALDELVAATLILYPLYVDPRSGEHINAETAVELLTRQRSAGSGPSLRTRVWRLIRKRV